MIFPKAKKIARELDWYADKNNVFGLYKGYFFTINDAPITNSPQIKFVAVEVLGLPQDQYELVELELHTHKAQLKFSSYNLSEFGLYFEFHENMKFTKLERIYALMDFVADLFKRLDIPEQNCCHECGSKERIDYYSMRTKGAIFCNSCASKIENDINEIERTRILSERSYVMGFLGALAFAIPGIIAWALVAYFLGKLMLLFVFLIAFLCFKGYTFVKGKQGAAMPYLILLATIISMVLANTATIGFALVQEGFDINHAIGILFDDQELYHAWLSNNLLTLFFTAIVAIWIFTSMKQQKITIVPAKKFVTG